MKFFTDKLWTQMNHGSVEDQEQVHLQWKGFHDYRLKNVDLMHSDYGALNPVEVALTVTDNSEEWNITFKKIKKLELKFECGESEFEKRRGFND